MRRPFHRRAEVAQIAQSPSTELVPVEQVQVPLMPPSSLGRGIVQASGFDTVGFYNSLLAKPGYRLAHDLATDPLMAGDPSMWDLAAVYGEKSKAVAMPVEATPESSAQLSKGSSVVRYLQSLVLLHFVEDGKRIPIPADRDQYPDWYGHFNQVIDEVRTTLPDFISGPALHQPLALLQSLKVYDAAFSRYYEPAGRGSVAASILAQVPWHGRQAEAEQAAVIDIRGIQY